MACKLFGMLVVIYLMSCVYSSPLQEQKPLDCPANEVYHKCSLEVCFKKCDDLRHPPPCPNISSDCYLPSCECKDDYLRNSEGVCVTYEECLELLLSSYFGFDLRDTNMACKLFGMLVVVYLMSCVYSSPLEEQKPLDCPANEVYHKCSLEVCYKKSKEFVYHMKNAKR
ncbi:unnamed protein product, partial [Brenthis ino]